MTESWQQSFEYFEDSFIAETRWGHLILVIGKTLEIGQTGVGEGYVVLMESGDSTVETVLHENAIMFP